MDSEKKERVTVSYWHILRGYFLSLKMMKMLISSTWISVNVVDLLDPNGKKLPEREVGFLLNGIGTSIRILGF